MFSLIQRKFIKNYSDTKNQSVREKYGIVFSVFSILCNLFLVVFKLIISAVTNSTSIRADALNNLSDVGSNVATLFGFKLSNKHPDADHPYGHGRIEYVSGMIVSFLILFMGISSLIDAVDRIIHPQETKFSIIALIILVASILIKLFMASINKKAGKTIESETLMAAGQDSLNDSIMTLATLVTLIINKVFKFDIDAYVAVVVSIFVLKSGIEIFRGVLDTILGQAPDKEFVNEIESYIKSDPKILGTHDLMFHDYGPASRFMTLHVEVDANENVLEIHDAIDNIEESILRKYNVLTTIHMDPVVVGDPEQDKNESIIKEIVKGINPSYSIHDFRMVKGPTHTNLVFDLVVPIAETRNHEEIRKELIDEVKEKDKTLNVVVKIEHSFVV